MGTEYSGECWCGNTIMNGGGPAPDGNAYCNMPCNGNASEICGGPNRLTFYYYNAGAPIASGTTTTGSAIATTTSSSTAAYPTLPTGWSYSGCFVDNINGRILPYGQPDDGQVTVESCVDLCAELGYNVSGIEYSSQCFCGQQLINGATSAPDSDCYMNCEGNSAEKWYVPKLY